MSVYDSDDALRKSPGLKPAASANYISESSVPPDSSSSSPETSGPSTSKRSKRSKRHKRQKRHNLSLVEDILIESIDQNQPEVAARAGRGSPSSLDSDLSTRTQDHEFNTENMEGEVRIAHASAPFAPDMKYRRVSIPRPTLGRVPQGSPLGPMKMVTGGSPRKMKIEVARPATRKVEMPESTTRRASKTRSTELERRKSSTQKVPTLSSLDLRAKRPRPVTGNSYSRPTSTRRREPSASMSSTASGSSIATSPTLQPHLIPDAQAPDEFKLAPLSSDSTIDMSPIPSLREELRLPSPAAFGRSLSFSSRTHTRATSNSSVETRRSRSPLHHPPPRQRFFSPLHQMPFRLSPSARDFRSSSPVEMYMPPAAAYDARNSPFDQGPSPAQRPRAVTLPTSYSSSGLSSVGPTSVPSMSNGSEGRTPSSMPTPSDRQTSEETYHSPTVTYSNLVGATGGSYVCKFEDCEARFLTAYLLHSHANVHSQERPHFCSVVGCPRSRDGKDGGGGKGFKRKNEMIRHGLVHESPGYICPFCEDKEHKYPRPDNLQRHVRMHHEDRDKEDPTLREILTRRASPSEGQAKGKKKRP